MEPREITAAKECPLCGGTMRFKQTKVVVQVPGNPQPIAHRLAEWICPDCDYFEEGEEGKTERGG